jgi:hypothetical protein
MGFTTISNSRKNFLYLVIFFLIIQIGSRRVGIVESIYISLRVFRKGKLYCHFYTKNINAIN